MAALRKPAEPGEESSIGLEFIGTDGSYTFSARTPEEIGRALRAYFMKAAASGDDQQASLDELKKAIDDSRPAGLKIFTLR